MKAIIRTFLLVLFSLYNISCACATEDPKTQKVEETATDVNPIDSTPQNEILGFPRITEGEDTPLTREILAFSKDVFLSQTYDWDALSGFPNKTDAYTILLETQSEKDDGENRSEDKWAQHKSSIEYRGLGDHSLYWLTPPINDRVFLVTCHLFNWRGYWHYAYAMDASALQQVPGVQERLLHADMDKNQIKEEILKIKGVQMLRPASWRKTAVIWHMPWIIKFHKSQQAVVIIRALGLSCWHVFGLSGEELCCIDFRPEEGDGLASLVPKGPLKQLITLLDDIIGIPSGWEGTLNPISRLRFAVEQDLANLILGHGLVMEALITL